MPELIVILYQSFSFPFMQVYFQGFSVEKSPGSEWRVSVALRPIQSESSSFEQEVSTFHSILDWGAFTR